MANTGRIPLWLIALVGGSAALAVLALLWVYSGLIHLYNIRHHMVSGNAYHMFRYIIDNFIIFQ